MNPKLTSTQKDVSLTHYRDFLKAQLHPTNKRKEFSTLAVITRDLTSQSLVTILPLLKAFITTTNGLPKEPSA